jgi:hypothetical protein
LKILLERRPGRVQQRHFRNNDQVDGSSVGHRAEHLSNQALGPVPDDRAAQLSRCHHAQPGRPALTRRRNECDKATVRSPPRVENVLKLPSPPQPPSRRKSVGRHKRTYALGLAADLLAGRGHGEALATLCPTALQHMAPVLRGHPNQEAMGLLAALPVRLKCTFALHDFWNPLQRFLTDRRN